MVNSHHVIGSAAIQALFRDPSHYVLEYVCTAFLFTGQRLHSYFYLMSAQPFFLQDSGYFCFRAASFSLSFYRNDSFSSPKIWSFLTDLGNPLKDNMSKNSAYGRDSKFLFRLPVLYPHPHTPQESPSIFKIEILHGGGRFLGGAGVAFPDCMLNFSTSHHVMNF